MRPRCAVWHRLAALALLPSTVAASSLGAPCGPPTQYSSCIDANALWPSPGAAHFIAIGSPSGTAAGRLAFGIQGQFLLRPLVLEVPGPGAEAREVRLVDYAIDETLLLEVGLGRGISLGAAVGVALYQRGTGDEGITSQRGAPLDSTGERDPRLIIGYSSSLGPGFTVAPRFELALPMGNQAAYAGGAGVALVPALTMEGRFARLRLAADLGVRFRRAVQLGTTRFGSQASLVLGVGWEVVSEDRAWLSAEVFALPSLIDESSQRGRDLGIRTRLVPAEYLVSIGVRPERDAPWTLTAGAGSGLPFSTETFAGSERTFVGPTSPKLRAVLALRYAPQD